MKHIYKKTKPNYGWLWIFGAWLITYVKRLVKKTESEVLPEPSAFISWKIYHKETIEFKIENETNMDVVWGMLPSNPPRPDTEVGIEPLFFKSELRLALLEEQGFICCYCNRALNDDHSTTIEHFLPKQKGKYPHLVFDYGNLLASCDGGRKDKEKPREVYCDAKKLDLDPISPFPIVSPFEEDCEAFFEFDALGKIHAKDGDMRASKTIEFLGLDARALNTLRNAAIGTYIIEILSDDTDIASEIIALRQKVNGKFQPFCTAIISVLRNYP